MNVWLVLINIAGAAALLIFAVRYTRSGIERAFGTSLRSVVRSVRQSTFTAVSSGVGLAILLQSSTAVAMLTTEFAATGVVPIVVGLRIVLGADVGSAFVVSILSLDLRWLMPLLLLVGVGLFIKADQDKVRQGGRAIIGVALILLSLQLVGDATLPLRESPSLPDITAYLGKDLFTAFVLGAIFTWALHSSVASVLLIATLVGQGLLPLAAGLAMMMGSNLGSGLIAMGLTRKAVGTARIILIGNLAVRGTFAIFALLALQGLGTPAFMIFTGAAMTVIAWHFILNLTICTIVAPLASPLVKILGRAIPQAEPLATDFIVQQRVSALDRSLIALPSRGLAAARRELLEMGDTIGAMLKPAMDLYEAFDSKQATHTKYLDRKIHTTQSDIKLYLADLTAGTMSKSEAQDCLELANLAIGLEHAADLIARELLALAEERADHDLKFSTEGWAELSDLHDRVTFNLQLAMDVLVSGDFESARRLVEEKDRMRDLERQSHTRHFSRLSQGSARTIETSDIHLRTIRCLKEINSIFATTAYPVLRESGSLLESRLATEP